MCSAPLFVSPLVKPAGHRPLEAVDFGFHIGVTGDLPLPPKQVFHTYLFLKSGRYPRSWIVTRATLGIWRCQSPPNGAGEVLRPYVDWHLVVQFWMKRNYLFQLRLEVGPVSAPEVRVIRWVMKGRATRSVNENREVVRSYSGARSQIHRE